MGTTNYGSQTIIFNYYYPTQGKEFSKLFKTLIKPGIYKGFDLTIVSNNIISISAGIIVIDADSDRTVVIKTTDSFSIIVDNTKPVIYAKFSWVDAIANYAEFLTRSTNTSVSNEVILGTCVFNGTTLDSINYDDKTLGFYDENYNINIDEISERTSANNIKINNTMKIDIINEQTTNNGILIENIKLLNNILYGNIINEKTSDNGVTIDNLKLKDIGLNCTFTSAKEIGSATTVSGATYPEITAIRQNEIAFYDRTNQNLIFFRLVEGTWTQIGSVKNIGASILYMSFLTYIYPVKYIITINSTANELQVYGFSGSLWNTYTTLSLTLTSPYRITTLNDTDIVVINQTQLDVYRWSRVFNTLTKIGNTFTISDITTDVEITALNNSKIAVLNNVENSITNYSFDGTNWTQEGEVTTSSDFNTTGNFTALNENTIVHLDPTAAELKVYKWNGTNWILSGYDNDISTVVTYRSLSALSGSEIVTAEHSTGYIQKYRLNHYFSDLPWNINHPDWA